ncbi:Hint domain-containing protein [Nitrosomonas communis]|uniref:Hint domain-containing protein n=1 Tax=Nitrosomonas communis TaxID=44574 RepID=A0A1H2XXH6_9PROT|nr:Hint domain-containing protein [Nitrosomonas communis]SDW97557.1 Hint domain-containing protein [Nitrosomonas communis]
MAKNDDHDDSMAITYTSITIKNIAGGNNSISKNDATKNGFKVRGEGSFAINGENSILEKEDEIAVTVTWSDGVHTFIQNMDAVVDGVNKNKGTFNWHIEENKAFENNYTGAGLNFGEGTVTVTFPGSISGSETYNYGHACFLRGTRILTRHGYCPVEELAVGDEVHTLNSGWQPLRWIGQQRIATPFGLAKSAPVRITAGAFGPALPERDVCVSQEHAIFFRNQLIPARFLINGVTVFRDTRIKDIEYFHLLLDRHAVIFSEGLATESYMPCENIEWFDNTSQCPQALLNSIRGGTAECLPQCYPRKTTGPVVEAARTLLARFAPVNIKGRAAG